MKKALLILSILTTTIISQAQIRFGPEAGLLFTKSEAASDEVKSKLGVGVRLGVLAELPISTRFSLQPGVYWGLRSSAQNVDYAILGQNVSAKTKYTFSYLEIPILAVMKFDAGPGRISVGLGPQIGLGLSGKMKVSGSGISVSADSSIKFGSDPGQLKPLEISGAMAVGYELDMGAFARIGYQYGINNLANEEAGIKPEFSMSSYSITVGYLIGGIQRQKKWWK